MASSMVTVFVLSPDTRSERRYDSHLKIGLLKNKLELITGIPVANQQIQLLDSEDDTEPIAVLSDDERPLGYYSIRDMQVLKVVDTNPASSLTGQFQDYSSVEKFELSAEEYARRQDSVLAYKQQHKLGRFAPQASPVPEAKQVTVPTESIPLNARCEVSSAEPGLKKRGAVRFVGPTQFAPSGVWVGIEYDEPMGKNDGSVQGVRYFTCRPNYGVFVRTEKVQVGDFPVEELDLDDEEM